MTIFLCRCLIQLFCHLKMNNFMNLRKIVLKHFIYWNSCLPRILSGEGFEGFCDNHVEEWQVGRSHKETKYLWRHTLTTLNFIWDWQIKHFYIQEIEMKLRTNATDNYKRYKMFLKDFQIGMCLSYLSTKCPLVSALHWRKLKT